MEWGEEGFEFFDAHCHIDRVLRGVNVEGEEELGKRWEILGLVQGGVKDKLGGIVTNFCWPGEWGNIEEVGGGV